MGIEITSSKSSHTWKVDNGQRIQFKCFKVKIPGKIQEKYLLLREFVQHFRRESVERGRNRHCRSCKLIELTMNLQCGTLLQVQIGGAQQASCKRHIQLTNLCQRADNFTQYQCAIRQKGKYRNEVCQGANGVVDLPISIASNISHKICQDVMASPTSQLAMSVSLFAVPLSHNVCGDFRSNCRKSITLLCFFFPIHAK